jgi:hypothetical protein
MEKPDVKAAVEIAYQAHCTEVTNDWDDLQQLTLGDEFAGDGITSAERYEYTFFVPADLVPHADSIVVALSQSLPSSHVHSTTLPDGPAPAWSHLSRPTCPRTMATVTLQKLSGMLHSHERCIPFLTLPSSVNGLMGGNPPVPSYTSWAGSAITPTFVTLSEYTTLSNCLSFWYTEKRIDLPVHSLSYVQDTHAALRGSRGRLPLNAVIALEYSSSYAREHTRPVSFASTSYAREHTRLVSFASTSYAREHTRPVSFASTSYAREHTRLVSFASSSRSRERAQRVLLAILGYTHFLRHSLDQRRVHFHCQWVTPSRICQHSVHSVHWGPRSLYS